MGLSSAKHASQPTRSVVRSILHFVIMLLVAFALAVFSHTFIFEPYKIPSGSMEQTIMPGDLVISEKVSYRFAAPKQGDIVTFREVNPNNSPEHNRILIKRIIATAGQTVDLQGGHVVVDGKPLSEPYTLNKPNYPLVGSHISFPFVVPEGCMWVMGDNRTNSQDSRFFGAVPLRSITGKAFCIHWPFNHMKLL